MLLVVSVCFFLACSTKPEKRNPNIIYILADDMGYGDVSSLNPEAAWKTARIDRLAEEGMIFTDAHTNSAVCSPTRYGVLTGRYAWRSRLKQGVLWSWDEPLIEPARMTVAKLLQKMATILPVLANGILVWAGSIIKMMLIAPTFPNR